MRLHSVYWDQVRSIHLISSLHTRYYQEQNAQARNKETFLKWTKIDGSHFGPNIEYGLVTLPLSSSVKRGAAAIITLFSFLFNTWVWFP